MKSIFKTANRNNYLYHLQDNKVLLLHPLINFFYEMENKGINPSQWIASLKGKNFYIKNLGLFSAKEILYYFDKYNLLKEKNCLSNVKDENLFQRRLTAYDIENLITCCKEVSFEIAKGCDLKCSYCIQGDLYRIHEIDQKINICVDKAIVLLKYLYRYWSRALSADKIGIKFYGGEIFTNFKAVMDIVEYTKKLEGINEKFYYYITTNGVLLDMHLDYLIANNFYISISLDGDKDNNSHRIYSNGKPSFDKINSNINLIRNNHPIYFEKNVSFQAVLHNQNSITEIIKYFKENFQKKPLMTELTRVGLNKERKSEFEKIYKSIYHNLYHGEDFSLLQSKKFIDLPKTPGSGIITHDIYNCLLKDPDEQELTMKNRTPTGTCHPFSKGIFMTTDGGILPCERIEHKFALGYINDDVILDFKAIADMYNRYYDKMNRLCCSCYNFKSCKKCMFYCKIEEPEPVCNQYTSQKDFLKKLSDAVEYMEDKPDIYLKHLFELND